MKNFTGKLLLLATLAFSALNAQVTKLNNNQGLQFVGLLDANRAVFYSHGTHMLWISDGTLTGTNQITSKVTYDAFGTVMNGRIYFRGFSPATGYELWRTDGTDAGTTLVQDTNPGTASSNPSDRLLVFANHIYFSAQTAAKGRELWKTDGTDEGTVLVKDIISGTGSSNTEALYKIKVAGNHLYFVANTNLGEELWKTDGTAEGTIPVRDINPGAASASPIILGTYQGRLVFTANDSVHGFEPWISNGSLAGTYLLKDLEPGSQSSITEQLVEFNGKMLFTGQEKVHGQEL
jgi:ELWxxDGT repeat protein